MWTCEVLNFESWITNIDTLFNNWYIRYSNERDTLTYINYDIATIDL